MPLFVPSSCGVARNQFLFEQNMFSDGLDTSINFRSCSYDPTNNIFYVGGDNSFCGSFSGGRNGKIEQFAALPDTVILTGDIQRIRPNDVDGGILVKTNNQMARSSDGGATWVDITAPLIVTYTDIISWQDDQIVACAGNGSIDLQVSTDNGATYPTQLNVLSAIVAIAEKTEDDSIIVFGCDGAQVFLTEDLSLATATFDTFNLSALVGFIGNVTTIGINPNGDEIVLGSNQGDIAVSIDRGQTWARFNRDANFFTNGAAGFAAIGSCTYIDDLDGFILTGSGVGAFIPGNGALDTMQPVFIPSGFGVGGEQADATDGEDLVIVANANNTARLPSSSA